ncbi:tumor necrosis factor ligand superfamily member 13B-like [Oncorhynchus mykiss]|uniref:tumor necrosis factor ligand superfamily member 13B-like n=1 Tax=Oncorhynchus mykiss TaxID=8022 RepID=UPI0018789985|nr:tumor necrosis factor ligand superfamily member 13B-like [Oncorhynchus mykiss]
MVSAGPSPEAVAHVPGQESGGRRLSWPVLLLILAAVTSSSLSALSLFHLLALRAEVEGLRAGVFHRREESSPHHPESQTRLPFIRERSVSTGPENTVSYSLVSQPCLQMLAHSNRETFQKEFALEPHTGIPWQEVLRRGSALEAESDSILVREEGYYFVYSQVYYMDTMFAMGHVVTRKKRNVVGDEAQHVTLFRCIQDMNPVYLYNTCYTGGIVKLEVGDMVELLIPHSTANISLDGDSSFLGAYRLV